MLCCKNAPPVKCSVEKTCVGAWSAPIFAICVIRSQRHNEIVSLMLNNVTINNVANIIIVIVNNAKMIIDILRQPVTKGIINTMFD